MEFDTVRAWKDACYRLSLSPEQQALLPASPVGEFELSEAELDAINGGHGSSLVGCQFTGGDESQCPTFGSPNGSCQTLEEGPHSVTAPSSGLLTGLTALTTIVSPLFTCA